MPVMDLREVKAGVQVTGSPLEDQDLMKKAHSVELARLSGLELGFVEENYESVSQSFGFSGSPGDGYSSARKSSENARESMRVSIAAAGGDESSRRRRNQDLIDATKDVPLVGTSVKFWTRIDELARIGISGGAQATIGIGKGAAEQLQLAGRSMEDFAGLAPVEAFSEEGKAELNRLAGIYADLTGQEKYRKLPGVLGSDSFVGEGNYVKQGPVPDLKDLPREKFEAASKVIGDIRKLMKSEGPEAKKKAFESSEYSQFTESAKKLMESVPSDLEIDQELAATTLGKLSNAAGSSIPFIASAFISPGLTIAAAESSLFSEAVDEYRKYQPDVAPADLLKFGLAVAVPGAVLERFGMPVRFAKILKEMAPATKGKVLLEIVKSFAGEGMTESAQGALLDFMASTEFDEDRETLTGEGFDRRLEEFLIGGTVGALFGGGAAGANFMTNPKVEFLDKQDYSPESFKALANTIEREEFAKAYESETLQDLARAAWDGSEGAQNALRIFSETVKANAAKIEAAEAEKAATREAKAREKAEKFELNLEEQEAFKEFRKVDSTEFMGEEELAQFQAEQEQLTAEEEAELERQFAEEEAKAALEDSVDLSKELLDLVREKGGLKRKDEALGGELDRIASDMKESGSKKVKGLFKKQPMELDDLRRSLEEDGFEFDTIADMLYAIGGSVTGTEQFAIQGGGIYTRPREEPKGRTLPRAERIKVERAKVREFMQKRLDKQKEKAKQDLIAARRKAESQKADIRIAAAKRLQKEIDKRIAQTRDLMEKRKSVTRSIRELEKLVQMLPLSVRGKFRGFGKLAGKITTDAQRAEINESMSRIQSIFSDYFRTENQSQLRKGMKLVKSLSGEAAKRLDIRITPEVREALELASKYAFMPKQDAMIEADGIRQEDGSFASEKDLLDYYVATTFAGTLTQEATLSDIAAARGALNFMLETGRTRATEVRERREQEVEEMKVRTVQGMVGNDLKTSDTLDEERAGAFFKAWDSVKNYSLTRMDGFETMMDELSIEKGRFQGYLQDTFVAPAFEATQNEHAAVRKDLDDFATVIAKAIGLSDRPTGREARRVKKLLDSWSNKTREHGIVYETEGVSTNVRVSVWEAMSIWMQWQDKSLAGTFEKMKIDEKTIEQVEEFIGPEGIAAAKAMMKWYKEAGKRMQNRVEDVNGYRPRLVENYSPVTRRIQDKDDFAELNSSEDFVRATEKNGSMKNRITTESELVFKPANSVFVEHVNNLNHYVAWAKIARDLKTVLGSSMVKRAIRQASNSDKAGKVLDEMVDDMIRGSISRIKINRTMDTIIRNLAVSKLAFNVTSAVKQLASVPAYADTIPTKEFAKGIADFWKNPVRNSQTLIKTQYIQNRIKRSYDRDLAQVANKATNLAIADIRNVKDKMMFLTRYGDLGAILQGGWAVYKYEYEKAVKGGKGHVEATQIAEKQFAMATDRAQQSAEIMSQSAWQRSGSFAKLFTMFMTSPIQYHRITWGAVRAAKRGRISKAEAAKTVMIYHVILPQVFTAMGSAFIGLWEDDDEVREGFWNRQKAALLYGNMNAIFLVGDALEAISHGLMDEDMPSFMENVSNPVLDTLSSVVSGFSRLFNADDEDQMISGADKLASALLSIAGVPYDPISNHFQGVMDAAQGDTDNPLLRFLGFSEYAIFEEQEKKSSSSRRTRTRSTPRREQPSR